MNGSVKEKSNQWYFVGEKQEETKLRKLLAGRHY